MSKEIGLLQTDLAFFKRIKHTLFKSRRCCVRLFDRNLTAHTVFIDLVIYEIGERAAYIRRQSYPAHSVQSKLNLYAKTNTCHHTVESAAGGELDLATRRGSERDAA